MTNNTILKLDSDELLFFQITKLNNNSTEKIVTLSSDRKLSLDRVTHTNSESFIDHLSGEKVNECEYKQILDQVLLVTKNQSSLSGINSTESSIDYVITFFLKNREISVRFTGVSSLENEFPELLTFFEIAEKYYPKKK